MKKERVFLIFGVWVAILPYLGFPFFWKNILFSLSGLAIIYLSFLLYQDSKAKSGLAKVFDNFSENKEFRDFKEGVKEVVEDIGESIMK